MGMSVLEDLGYKMQEELYKEALEGVRNILKYIGEDPDREV